MKKGKTYRIMKKVIKTLFDIWVHKNARWFDYFQVIAGLLSLLLIIGIASSFVLAIWFLWWWKITLLCAGAFVILALVYRIIEEYLMLKFYAAKSE